jgi:hypothetical protein
MAGLMLTPKLPKPPVITPAFDPTSVSQQLTKLTGSDSPYITQARASGMDTANRRGLLNSSIAAGTSEAAAIGAAAPIASQEASQAYGREQQQKGIASTEKIAQWNINSNDRQQAANFAAAAEATYSQSFSAIASNPNLPKEARESYLAQIGKVRDSNLALVEQLYHVDLDWGSSSGAGGAPTPTPVKTGGGGTGTGTGTGAGGNSFGLPSTDASRNAYMAGRYVNGQWVG